MGVALAAQPRILLRPPEELCDQKLRRIGEGIGKVVYASDHWVVKRERSNREVIALIVLWKMLRPVRRLLPSRLLRFLRVLVQSVMVIVPKSVWFESHVGELWRNYRRADIRGEYLAQAHLSGSGLVPEQISFPPARVRVGGWPGWLIASEASERVEATLHERLAQLSRQQRFEEVELWLDRFLALRQAGWQRGVFSVDAHLKNYGVTGERVVLLDPGGLTNRWSDIEKRLTFEDVVGEPHIQLGLGPALGARPDIAERFNARWKAIVNRAGVRAHWPHQDSAEYPSPAATRNRSRVELTS